MRKLALACAALALFAGVTVAQTTGPPPPTETAPSAQTASPDPERMAAAVLALASEGEKCRFIFTQTFESEALANGRKDSINAQVRFDPRNPLGQRWYVLNADKHARSLAVSLAKDDTRGLPADLASLLPEGQFTIENLTPSEQTGDTMHFAFQPRMRLERVISTIGVDLMEKLQGELEASATTGEIGKVALTTPTKGFHYALAKVRSVNLSRTFALVQGRFWLAQSATESIDVSALASSSALTSTVRFSDFTPLCDPVEVARINALEEVARDKAKAREWH